MDGKRTLDEVLAATAATGVTREDIDSCSSSAWSPTSRPRPPPPKPRATAAADAAVKAHKERTPQERYAEAYPIATAADGGAGLARFPPEPGRGGRHQLRELLEVAPKIRRRSARPEYAPLEDALNDR